MVRYFAGGRIIYTQNMIDIWVSIRHRNLNWIEGGDCGTCPVLPSPTLTPTTTPFQKDIAGYKLCQEKWECTEWEECNRDNFQTRECIDINKCGSKINRPYGLVNCVYIDMCKII